MADSEPSHPIDTVNSFLFVLSFVEYYEIVLYSKEIDHEIDFSFSLLKVNLNEKRLKYLEFVQVAAIYAVVCFSSLYEYAKENAGPLKPGVQTVEGTVKAVVGPVYEKFQDLPFQLLKFVDRKVRLVHRLRLNLISFPVTELCGLHFAGGRVIQRAGASRALPREAGVE